MTEQPIVLDSATGGVKGKTVTDFKTLLAYKLNEPAAPTGPVAMGAQQITGLGSGGSTGTNAANIADIGLIAPAAHSGSHGSGGTDPITITESQVTNLVADLAAKLKYRGAYANGTYAVGDVVLSSNKLWVCTSAFTTGTYVGSAHGTGAVTLPAGSAVGDIATVSTVGFLTDLDARYTLAADQSNGNWKIKWGYTTLTAADITAGTLPNGNAANMLISVYRGVTVDTTHIGSTSNATTVSVTPSADALLFTSAQAWSSGGASIGLPGQLGDTSTFLGGNTSQAVGDETVTGGVATTARTFTGGAGNLRTAVIPLLKQFPSQNFQQLALNTDGLGTGLVKNVSGGATVIAVAADVPVVAAGVAGPLSATDATVTTGRVAFADVLMLMGA